jgi:predicted RNA-binding protein (virulence factor B family)
MKCLRFLALAGALILTAAIATAAQTSATSNSKQATQSSPQAKAVVHHEMGTVSSLTGTELMLAHKWRGKEEKTKFTLDSNTKKEGSITQGQEVTVYFHHEKGERIATEIKASQTKPSTETKKS